MKQLYIFLFLLFSSTAFSQISQNMTLNSNWDESSLPTSSGVRYNDIWGHVDCQGNEYAIVGSARYTHFFNVTNPNNINEVSRIEGTVNSIWRDFKTYKNYAYGVADQGNEGLSVFDMSNLPNSAFLVARYDSDFTRSHNIYIDEENGRLYVAGSNGQGNGLIVYDLTTNPAAPEKIASVALPGGGYVHDIYVRDNIAYCSHGWNGYYIWNMANPSNPILLGSVSTNGYNHSSWVTTDGNYAIVAEEVPAGLPLLVVDLTNLASGNIAVVKDFKEPLLAPNSVNNTPHNPFIRGKHLISSYYEDGVQVFDISDPLNPDRIAYYDTAPGNTSYNGTNNNWGVYPFLPSGTIIATDTDNGFFVLTPTYDDVAAVSYNSEPNVEWVNNSDLNVCEGATVVLETTGTADNYQWYKNGARIDGETGTSLTIQSGGIFNVEVDNNVCFKNLSTIEVNFQTLPSVEFTPIGISTIELCEGNASTVSVPLGAETYTWSKDGISFSESNEINITASGVYQVTASINGCPSISELINVNTSAYPNVDWSIPDSIAICAGDTTLLEIEAGAEQYTWYLFGVELNGETNASLQASASGDYTVEATNNGCSSVSSIIKVHTKSLPLTELNTNTVTLCSEESATIATNQGAESYMWTLNGAPFEGNSFEINTNQTGIYQVTAETDGCMSTSPTVEVVSDILPNVTLNTTGDVSLCEGEEYNLVVPSGAENFQWYMDGVAIANASNNAYNVTESGNYSLQASNGNCTATSASIEVTITQNPVASILTPQENTMSLCEGETIELTAETQNGTYQWLQNGVELENTNQNTLVASESGSYQIRVTENGCSSTSDAIQVTIFNYPNVVLNMESPLELCQGENLELSVMEQAEGNFQWFKDGIAVENETDFSYNVTASGNYSLQATNGNCTVSSESIDVTIFTSPNASIIAPLESEINLCEGETIELAAMQQNGTFQWLQNGLGLDNTNQNTLMVSESGTYQVMLTENNCSNLSEEIQINIVNFPNVDLNVDTAISFCEGESVSIEIASGADAYQWLLNGMPLDKATNNNLVVETAGAYAVNATSNGCTMESKTVQVSVNTLPTAEFIDLGSDAISICEGETTILNVTEGADMYVWTKDGTIESGFNTSSIELSQAGTYQVAVTQNDCTTQSSVVTLTVNQSPNVELNTQNAINLCQNPIFDLAVTAGADSYQWFLDGMLINDATASNFEVSEAGAYAVTAESNGCSASSELIVALANPTIDTTITPTIVNCGESSFNISTTATLGSFEWIKDGDIIDTVSTVLTIVESGSYQLIIYENDCPISVQMFSLEFVSNPNATVVVDGAFTFCEGESVVLAAEEVNPVHFYSWYKDGVLVNQVPSYTVTETGVYYLEVMNNETGCISASEEINIVVNEIPTAAVFVEGEQLTASISGTYQWYLEGEMIIDATNQIYLVQETGNYSVEITDSNGCMALSNSVFIMITSINKVESTIALELFPNPASNFVSLQLTSATNTSYQLNIFNTIGQAIFSKKLDPFIGQKEEIIPVENWESGVYLVRLTAKDQFLYKKIIIE